MGKYRYLIKNIGLLTLASFATKLLSFFLVPLYTNVLTTDEYGTYDIFNTTISVLIPILTLNIQDAVIRFSLDKKINNNIIISIGFRYAIFSNLIVVGLTIINCIFDIWKLGKEYALMFTLSYFVSSFTGVITGYTRGIDKIVDLSVSSVLSSAVTILLNLLFLLYFKWGLLGYFLSNIIGPFVQVFYLTVKCHVFKHLELFNRYSAETKQMLSYSKPLIANALAWWVNNASDRYVVIFFCGLAANGVYSVASKIPQILNVFQTIFNQAWTLSAVKDYDPEDKSGFFANTYKVYNCMMTIICSAVIVADKILAYFLYAKDFYVAWRYVPWLTIAILFGALSGYVGGFFSAVKDSKVFAQSTVTGAVSNIILNIIFTPIMGPLGAAIATTVCYVIVFAIRFVQSKKYIKLRINLGRDVISYVLLIVQSVVLLFVDQNVTLYTIIGGIFLVIVLMYVKDIKLVLNKVKNR